MTELKSCPFCGNEEVRIRTTDISTIKGFKTGFYIDCSYCGSRSNVFDSREKAYNAWNKRLENIKVNELKRLCDERFFTGYCNGNCKKCTYQKEDFISMNDILWLLEQEG